MPNLVKRRVKGKQYFYLESTIRIEKKVQKISVYLGKLKPTQESIKIKEKELAKKIESFLYGYFGKDLNKYTSSFLTNEQLLEAEILKKKYFDRIKKLSRQQKEAFSKKQLIDFVYTTLRTEGVEVNSSDVDTAFKILRKKRGEGTLNEKVIISSLMISGYNLLKNLEINKKDLLRLHGIVMSYFEGKSPGQLRDDQRVIMKFNPKLMTEEEIKYRPPAPLIVEKEFDKFFEWFSQNRNLYPIELAALTHLKLYLVHPFKDGNKRMCRLIFNKILQDASYPMLNISKETSEYFEALIKSVEEKDEKYFVQFCYKTFIKQVRK
ncbi:MAG: Fic family protein [Candidatus ainarchaeum sp.]|nr:Fic family protein [Candidatus ainarchaeum sp.]